MNTCQQPIFARRGTAVLAALACASLLGATSAAAQAVPKPAKAASAAAPATAPAAAEAAKAPVSISVGPQSAQFTAPTEVAPAMRLTVGKSAVVRLPGDATRLSIGNPEIADVMLINPREVYLLGRKSGSTNVFVWTKSGRTTIMDVLVGLDTATLKTRLAELVPGELAITVESLGDSVVLSGSVSDPMRVQRLVSLAEVYSGGKKVINLLSVEGSQQVMLEVKVAEVSKTLIDKLGVEFDLTRTSGNTSFTLLTQLLSGAANSVTGTRANGRTAISLDAEVKNGLVKILAEPTIMAMSGQEGAFLAGGRIYIPVPQSNSSGGSGVTLEEKEFGVGLRFTPTLLEGGRINLRVTPEVSELSQIGTPITTLGGQTSILPTITTRRASTTVQLRDGESFAIGGLIKNNVTESIKALPMLGELPVLGALFRSSEFQTDRSELMFIVTPRLVKPLPANYAMPTDSFVPPSRSDFLLGGRMEGEGRTRVPPPAPAAPPAAPAQPGGFQLK
ncbi:type II and III secretion system protein family protein [Caenimonas sp. SL110]|uniref:type II and III secretion system protein family protein n=1 Tax=Caenimonas sp. SL110 TaxID=1450524 RepID=UPI0009E3868C|nr:type II and III secretion system protein family protein [Caenimonas sp. SL110]